MRGDNNRNLSAVGNDFIVSQPRLRPALQTVTPAPLPMPALSLPIEVPVSHEDTHQQRTSKRTAFLNLIHEQSIIVFALLFLLVGVATIQFGTSYIMNHDYPVATSSYSHAVSIVGGLNKTVSNASLASFMASLTSQPATLNLGGQTVNISPSTIKSWLSVTQNSKTNENYIHVDAGNISSSLSSLANQYVIAPVDQVTITRSDGSSEVAIGGKNGTKLDPSANLAAQAVTISKNLFSNKGFSVNAPLITLPFQSVTPAAFSKLIVADTGSKKMYLYQNGQLINTFLVSAGKPSTPTPIGEFHIWDKLTSQTMVGPGYVQPNVPYINYFDHSGDAIHGVYWRPASVFGNVNTSHGCVGVPVSTAEYIFNWAPIGTTVITTLN
jgi:lipoprotein-anchoring transpeptidase ErfK/SrfK